MEEIWKAIPGYEGIYEVNNFGDVKSLSRLRWNGYKFVKTKERILRPGINGAGYYYVNLMYNNVKANYRIHQLVGIVFLNHIPNKYDLVIDHINNNKLDNRVENLQIITHRENCHKRPINSTSKYVGVHFVKNRNKWRATITVDGKKISLGSFINEEDANLAYQNKLKQIL
jgi:hypothetical protein